MKNIVNSLCLLLLVLLGNHLMAQCTLPPNAIYVVPGGTGSGSAGSPTNIATALAIHKADTSRNPILMSSGVHNVSQILYIPSFVTVEGGYTNTNGVWEKNPAHVTTLEITPPFHYYDMPNIPRNIFTDLTYETVQVASLIGLYLDSVQKVKLKDFKINLWTQGSVYLESRDGYSVYGIYSYRSKDIEISNLDITTSDAQNGGDGEDDEGNKNFPHGWIVR